jgi:putative nucleotidyltransferase with HDIG domain
MAQICAAKMSRPDDPRLFTAAILHDIGKMVLGEFVHESWEKIQKLVEKQRYSFLEAEEEVIGVNHAELGGEVARIWKFPDEILKAIAFHHRPDQLADGDAVPWIVYLANQVCHIMGIGVGTDALSYRAVGDVAGRLSLKQRDLEDMMAELHLKLQGAKELVSIVSEQKESGRG